MSDDVVTLEFLSVELLEGSTVMILKLLEIEGPRFLLDELHSEIHLFLVGLGRGDFVIIIRRFAKFVRVVAQHFHHETIFERRHRDQPLPSCNGQLRKPNLSGLAQSITNDGITRACHPITRDGVPRVRSSRATGSEVSSANHSNQPESLGHRSHWADDSQTRSCQVIRDVEREHGLVFNHKHAFVHLRSVVVRH
jgi:hypothetical protein